MQQKQSPNTPKVSGQFRDLPAGRVIAVDPGTKRVGIAVTDELRITARPLERLERTSWKKLLQKIKELVSEFDAVALVVGLPLETDGGESPMSVEARDLARKFELSLEIPVFLQDERVSSYEAKGRLWRSGMTVDATRRQVDSEAAVIILEDFLSGLRT